MFIKVLIKFSMINCNVSSLIPLGHWSPILKILSQWSPLITKYDLSIIHDQLDHHCSNELTDCIYSIFSGWLWLGKNESEISNWRSIVYRLSQYSRTGQVQYIEYIQHIQYVQYINWLHTYIKGVCCHFRMCYLRLEYVRMFLFQC